MNTCEIESFNLINFFNNDNIYGPYSDSYSFMRFFSTTMQKYPQLIQ